MTTGVLLLAAGRSLRFGADKRFAQLPGGNSVFETTLDRIADSGLPVLVCLAPDDDALARRLAARGVAYRFCRRAGEGMGGTLAEGVGYLPPGWEGVLVALADMPWILATSYRAVAGKLSGSCIVVPAYDGRRGHPVGFGRRFYPELAALSGDSGARALLRVYTTAVSELPLGDPAILRDIDRPEDI